MVGLKFEVRSSKKITVAVEDGVEGEELGLAVVGCVQLCDEVVF